MDCSSRRVGAWLTIVGELEGVRDALDADAYEGFASWFDRVEPQHRLFFAGQGRSGLVVHMVAMRFMHMHLPAHVVGEATAPSVRAGDTLVLVSGSGHTPTSVGMARVAKDVGASVLLVTHQEVSPLRDLADASIVIPVASSVQFGGTLFEESALILLDSIVFDQIQRRGVDHALMFARHTNFL